MGASQRWHVSQVYVRVEETGNKRRRETNDRKMQPEKNDTDERVTDEQGRETVAVAGGNDSGNGAEEP